MYADINDGSYYMYIRFDVLNKYNYSYNSCSQIEAGIIF